MFKYRSISGFIIFLCEGLVTWKFIRQPHTSLSSCEAKVQATNNCKKLIQNFRHFLSDLSQIDLYIPTKCYSNNHAYADWSKSFTTKRMKCISLHDNQIRECVHNKDKYNPPTL